MERQVSAAALIPLTYHSSLHIEFGPVYCSSTPAVHLQQHDLPKAKLPTLQQFITTKENCEQSIKFR